MLNKFRALRLLLINWKHGQHNAKLARLQSENDWKSHIKPFPLGPLAAMTFMMVLAGSVVAAFAVLTYYTWPTSVQVMAGAAGVSAFAALFVWSFETLGDL